MSRRSLLVSFTVLLACVAITVGCKKKKADTGGGDDSGGGGGGATPAAVSSDYFVYFRVDAKSIRENPLFGEIKQAVTKSGATDDWDKKEAEAVTEIGVKPTDIDTVTGALMDVPLKGPPQAIVIVTARVPFQKDGVFGMKPGTKPDARGMYPGDDGKMLVHYPDDKTAAIMSPELAQKYLDGYAKNKSGWPMTADLTRAAAGHTAYVSLNVSKIPTDQVPAGAKDQFGPLLSARSVALTIDLKGKELGATLRGTFPDAATAEKSKELIKGLVSAAPGLLNMATSKDGPPAEFMPAVKEAQRAVQATKVEASGADVVVSMTYKADFDIGQMVVAAVKQAGAAGGRMKAQNDLKQIGLALINYADSHGGSISVLGIGANGAPLRNATDKPLLSWRVAILPYIEQDALYKQFKLNEPWNSPNNIKLLAQMPKIYAPTEKPGKPGFTHLRMVVGAGGMPIGARYPASITDGTSNTVAVIEAAEMVEWTKPDDVTLPAKPAPGALKAKFGGQYPGGFHVVMWDGNVRFVKDSVSERTLANALNPSDGQVLGSDW